MKKSKRWKNVSHLLISSFSHYPLPISIYFFDRFHIPFISLYTIFLSISSRTTNYSIPSPCPPPSPSPFFHRETTSHYRLFLHLPYTVFDPGDPFLSNTTQLAHKSSPPPLDRSINTLCLVVPFETLIGLSSDYCILPLSIDNI